MNIEPLKTILSISKDKKETLFYFLSNEIKQKLYNCNYEEKDFFINDYLYCIKRNTLELQFCGRIFCVEKKKIGIKKSTYMNIYLNPKEYYLFVKNSNKLQNKREFLKQLLNNI